MITPEGLEKLTEEIEYLSTTKRREVAERCSFTLARLGYRYDQAQSTHALSAGVGYIDPQFSIDFAVGRTVAEKVPFAPVTSIVIDIQYFIESTGLTRSPAESE